MSEGRDPVIVAVLPVTDLGRSIDWYEALGFEVRWHYDDDGYAILALGRAELHLRADDSVGANDSPAGCYLRVSDADEVHARWMAAGAREVGPLVDQPYGIREFAAEDPDGNLWRVGATIAGAASGGENGSSVQGSPDDDESWAEAQVADGRPSDGSPGTGEEDWSIIVATSTCAGCGLRASESARAGLGGLITDEAQRLGRVVTVADDLVVRTRPAPDRWSAMEYAAHVRDALAVLTERVVRTLREDDPDLGWWDQDAAVEAGWANDEEATSVADDVARNASHLHDVLVGLTDAEWERTATRRGEVFTVELLARYALHEVVHHRMDAAGSLAGD